MTIRKAYDYELAKEWCCGIRTLKASSREKAFLKRGYKLLGHTAEKVEVGGKKFTVWLFEMEELPERKLAVQKAQELLEKEREKVRMALEHQERREIEERTKRQSALVRQARKESDENIKALVLQIIDNDDNIGSHFPTRQDFLLEDRDRKLPDTEEKPYKPTIRACDANMPNRLDRAKKELLRKIKRKRGLDINTLLHSSFYEVKLLCALGYVDMFYYYEHDTWTGAFTKKYKARVKSV